jgi:predicted transcriptional regulator
MTHPLGNHYRDGQTLLATMVFAAVGEHYPRDPSAFHTVESWRRLLNFTLATLTNNLKEDHRKIPSMPAQDRKRLKQRVEQVQNQINAEYRKINRLLDEIENGAAEDIPTKLDNLYQNAAKQTRELLGQVPGSELGTPNYQVAAQELTLAPSEKTVLALGDALGRGKFKRESGEMFPSTNVDGPGFGENFRGSERVIAQLVHNHAVNAEPDDSDQQRLDAMAAVLADTRKAAGPRGQQVLEAILGYGIKHPREDGSILFTIDQLAESLRYTRHGGRFLTADLDEIRKFVEIVMSVRLTAMNGNSRVQGAVLVLNYVGYANVLAAENGDALITENGENIQLETGWEAKVKRNRWTNLRVTPHPLITHALKTRPQLMGRDEDLNTFHPVNERADLLLGKYLEKNFRLNWNKSVGLYTRSVRELLGAAGLSTETPRIVTLKRLKDALDKLEEHGTLAEYEDTDRRFEGALELPENKRMTDSLWNSALDSRIELEPGRKYVQHYRNFRLTQQLGDTPSVVLELKAYQQKTGRSLRVIAEELGTTASTLSRCLSGKSKPAAKLAERIEALVRNEIAPQLPFE